jgi:hypothetical protein
MLKFEPAASRLLRLLGSFVKQPSIITLLRLLAEVGKTVASVVLISMFQEITLELKTDNDVGPARHSL